MSSANLAKQASVLARRSLLFAFGGLALLALLSLAAHLMFGAGYADAEDRLGRAREAANNVLLADERLTMSANMAAATGEARWLARYNENLTVMDAALAAAKAMADPAVAARFDAETSAANDRLVRLERQAQGAVRVGDLARARAILDSSEYARDKRVFSAGVETLVDAVIADVGARLRTVQRATLAILPLIALLTITAAWAAWRRLTATLARSESEIDAAETRIRDLSLTDALTGVANRRALRDYLSTALSRAEPNHAKVALLVLDLDRFKPINEAHGQVVGDLVLKEVARRVAEILNKGEFCARSGGDEFAVVIEAATVDCVRRLAHRLVESLCAPMQVDGHELDLTASIGAAMFPTVAQNVDDLLRKTDIALRRARQENRGAVRVYDLSMEVETTERLQLEADLRESIDAGALTPHFLPVVDLQTGAVASFEILARWRHPRHGEICPNQFLPIVESLGLINEMTISVLEAACRDARVLPENITLSLNVSPAQIQDQWLVERLLKVLTKTGFPAQRLQVEVSENALVLDLAAAKRVISALNNIGVRVALDNFGSGYSSLSYLAELSFDVIKIDSSFVRAAPDRPESAKIVAAIVSLSKSLGVTACAEGVETAAQADFLRGVGCGAAQGFYFARPMPPAQAALALSVNLDDLREASQRRASA